MKTKEWIIDELPRAINNWRMVPRLIVVLYGWVFYHTLFWYMSLPDPTTQQTSFISIIVGAAAAFFGFYANTGSLAGRNNFRQVAQNPVDQPTMLTDNNQARG